MSGLDLLLESLDFLLCCGDPKSRNLALRKTGRINPGCGEQLHLVGEDKLASLFPVDDARLLQCCVEAGPTRKAYA